MPDPSLLFCTDEDIRVRCAGDFDELVPSDQVLAAGTDGVIAADIPWVLHSATCDFEACGLKPGHVIEVTDPTIEPDPLHFAVVQAFGHAVQLRRIGLRSGVGMPPKPGSDLAFAVPTFTPQIEDATYDLDRQFAIDDNAPNRATALLYDPRELRQACVLRVLYRQYANETRTKDGDFSVKLGVIKAELDETLARLNVRWGELGTSQSDTGRFSLTLRR